MLADDVLEALPVLRMDCVFHVGTLDPDARTARASLEGPCLSVSQDPDAWAGIARIAGPEWELSRPGALWLDVCALSDDQERAIVDWAVDEGLLEKCTIWRAWWIDGESDDWVHMRCDSEAEAWYEVLDDEAEDAPTEHGGPVDFFEGHRLTGSGMDLLERWSDPLDGPGGAVILFAMSLADRVPDLCGLWWGEEDNPLSLPCPRGGILPERLSEFEAVSMDAGISHPKGYLRHAGRKPGGPDLFS